MAIECDVDQTLQTLDPEGTTVDLTGDRPLEDGETPLVVGQQYLDVTFLTPHSSYNFDQLLQDSFSAPTLQSFENFQYGSQHLKVG